MISFCVVDVLIWESLILSLLIWVKLVKTAVSQWSNSAQVVLYIVTKWNSLHSFINSSNSEEDLTVVKTGEKISRFIQLSDAEGQSNAFNDLCISLSLHSRTFHACFFCFLCAEIFQTPSELQPCFVCNNFS